MSKKIRVGIAGFDHFFAGLGAMRDLLGAANAELVIAAHHDPGRVQQEAGQAGARVTTNYREVVDADIDLLITACPTDQNAELVIAAAEQGKHILSVKPFAMNLAEADQVVAAVKRAGVRFISFDITWRFNPLYQQVKSLLGGGELGRPLSAFCLLRSSLPAFVWFGDPFEMGQSWWLDPRQAPGGGWIDHAIYYVDALRWLFDSEITRVSGEIANLKHVDQAQEDFGVGTFVFKNGSIATIEDTWHVEGPGFITAFQLVTSRGGVLAETTRQGTSARRIVYGGNSSDWEPLNLSSESGSVTAHMLAVLSGEAEPIANEDDARANLAACFAFYQAAQERRSIEL